MKTIVSLALVALLSAASAFADQQLSTSTHVSSGWGDSVFLTGPSQHYDHDQTAPPGTSLSDSGSNSVAPWGSASGSVNLYYGSCGMTASGAGRSSSSEQILGGGSGSLSASWISLITINSPGMEGQPATVRLTYHASGAVSGSGTSYLATGSASYSYSVGDSSGNGVGFYGNWDTQSYAWSGNGSPNRTFTLDATCTIGQPCEIAHYLSWSVGGGTGEPDFGDAHDGTAQANGNLSFSGGSFVVLDPDGNSLDYTADSPSGSSQAVTYPAGASFSNFSLTNAAPDRSGTTMQLLGGTAGGSPPTQVVASFVAPPEPAVAAVIKPVSDALELIGTAGRLTVVQMSYNPDLVGIVSVTESDLRLVWRVPVVGNLLGGAAGNYVNAVFGNSGPAASQFVPRAYNAATDFQLGKHGLDTTNHTAWAVVDHNSEFVVAKPQAFVAVKSVSRLPATNTVRLNCYGQAGAANLIETSTDLQHWTTLTSVTADDSGAFTYDDTAAAGPKKFYRVSYPGEGSRSAGPRRQSP